MKLSTIVLPTKDAMPINLDNLPRIHPREIIVHSAKLAIAAAIKDLTDAEAIEVLSREIAMMASGAVVNERRPRACPPTT